MAQCAGCQAQIFDKYLFNVVDRSWHGRCLQCQDCSMPLSEKCFFKEGKLFCRTDFYKRYGTKCFGCGEGICPTDLVRRARSKVFHVKCFKCMICGKQLCTGEELYVVGEEFYLCRDDYLNSYHQQQQPFRHHLYTAEDISCNEHGPPPYFQNNFPVRSISTTAEPLLTPFQLVPDNFTTPRSFFNPIMKLPLSAGSNIPPFMKKPQKSLKIRQPKCKGGILLPSANPKEEYSPRKKEGGGGAEKQGQPMDESDHLKFSLPQQQPKSAKMSPITTSSSLGASKIRKKKCSDKLFQKLPSQGNHISKKSITIKQEQQEDTTTATIVEKEKPKGFADENSQELRGTTVMTLTSCYNDEPPPPPQAPATSKSPPKDFGTGGICDENWNDRYTNANFATSSSGSILDNEMIINFSNETTGASATISTTKMTGDVKLENNLSLTESYHHSYSSAFLEHDINNKNQNNVPLNEENYHDHHQVMRRAQQEATSNSCCNKQQLQSLVADQKMETFETCDIKNKVGFDFEFATSNHCRPDFRLEGGGGGRTAARSSRIDMMYDDEVEMEGSDDYDEEEDDDADLDLEEGGADYDEEGEDEDSLLLIEEDMEDEDIDENAYYGTDRARVNAFPKRPFDPSAGGYDMPPPSMSYPLQPESSTTSDNNDNNLVLPNQSYSGINQSSSSRPQLGGPNSRSNSPPSSSGGVLGLSSNNNNNRKNSFHHHHHHLSSADHQKFPLESGCGSNNSNAYYNSCLSHHHQTGFSGGGGLMPSNGSGGGAGGSCNNKRRGPRTTIKAKQLETLKSAFSATPKPTRHIREQLARETGLNMRVIQVWFQNRRSKERRMKQLSALGARRHFFRHTRRIRSSMIRPELTGIGNMGAASSTIITQGPPHSNQHPHQHLGLGQMRTDLIPNEQDPNCQQMYPPALIQQHSQNPNGNAGSPVDNNNMSNNNPNNNTRQPWETISNYHHHNTTDITISISANSCPGGQYVDIKSSSISNDPNVVPSFDHPRHHSTSISYLNNPNTGDLLISEYKDVVPAAPPQGKGNLLINLYPPFPDFSNGIIPTVAELETSSIHAPLQNYRLPGNSSNLMVDEENHGRPNENTQTQNARLIPCEEDAQTKLYESLDNENYTFNNNRAIGSTEINPYYSHHHISASESRENSNENYLHSSSHMMKTTLIGGSSEPCQYYTPNITEFTGL